MQPQLIMHFRQTFVVFFWLIAICFHSCTENKNQKEVAEDPLSSRGLIAIQPISSPVTLGNSIPISGQWLDKTQQYDSLLLLINGQKAGSLGFDSTGNFSFSWNSGLGNVGTQVAQVQAFFHGKELQMASATFQLKSDIVPENLSFQLAQTLPHNPQSFTQGLEWSGKKLYEGTGLHGKSAVMEIQAETGEAKVKIDLEQDYFGEGITVVNNLLYQITWQNKTGFVYKLPELKKVNSFTYATEGWGLSHWQGNLIMSDGSNRLYILDPQTFSRKKIIEVWDNKGPVDALNELEMIDGYLFANKYQTDQIVKIDPENGKVMGYLDLSGILKDSDRTGEEDVLNGMAWNAEEKLLYVTGKNWPKMFAIRLTKKKTI